MYFNPLVATVLAGAGLAVAAPRGTSQPLTSSSCVVLSGSCGPDAYDNSGFIAKVAAKFGENVPLLASNGQRYGCVPTGGSDGGQFCAVLENTSFLTGSQVLGYLNTLNQYCNFGSSSCGTINASDNQIPLIQWGGYVTVQYFAS
ncbi:MAG: hypothetical protein M1838_000134 [Thelocarpon superellum]|nr:MAG: hypothetical protein M1838_000134 [Thelocarpon superellum]